MSIVAAAGKGAESGVLFRNAEAIEHMRSVDVLLVDKTGTLTEGKPTVENIQTASAFGQEEVLALAAAVERHSEHPLAAAILAAARERGVAAGEAENFESHTGRGIEGRVDDRLVRLGSRRFMQEFGLDTTPLEGSAGQWEMDGATVVWLAVGNQLAAAIGIADPIKPRAREAVDELHREGLKIVMVSGDQQATADAVAVRLGIDEVIAGVLPEQKLEVVRQYQARGARVAMAGDGINDSPALAAADVGIAMGTGTDIAMESADITLVKGDLSGIARARRLSRMTMRNIRQNLFFAFVYNGVGVPVAAGVLYPFFGILLSPMLAAAAMSFSSVSVISNSLRLRRAEIQ
jgi:Cu+-exporting ATPase